MGRVVVIGGAGHVGSFLVPQLVEAGHEVINISRGAANPYIAHSAWNRVRQVTLDRVAEEALGGFGGQVADLAADVVVDMICFTPESAAQLTEALRGRVEHLLHVGTIWVHGTLTELPARESDPREPFGEYGLLKSQIEDQLLAQSRRGGVATSVVRPGHIVGPGWAPLNPAGHFNPQVFRDIAAGKPLCLPNFGLETLHHVHAEDVAQVLHLAMKNRNRAVGEAFNAVSPAALSLRGYAQAMYRFFGQTAELTYLPFDAWAKTQSRTRPPALGTISSAARFIRSPRLKRCSDISRAGPHWPPSSKA